MLRGGAPRDWYFDRPANDIDIYLYRPDLQTSHAFTSILNSVGIAVRQRGSDNTNHPLYETNSMIYKVFDSKYKGLRFQFIFMREKTFTSVVPTFPLNICKIWYKNGTIHTTKDFIRAVTHKAIVKVNTLYADGDKYINKVLGYFPDYKYYYSYEALAAYLLDNG